MILRALPAASVAAHLDYNPCNDINVTALHITPCPITILQYNVRSLKSNRRTLLRSKLCKAKVAIACLQETRTGLTGVQKQAKFICASSAATADGDYGTEVWFNTKVPIANINQTCIHPTTEDISIVKAAPRELVVRVVCKHFPFL